METQALQTIEQQQAIVPMDVSITALEKAVGMGDVSALPPAERLRYVAAICQSTGLNPLTLPIRIIKMDGRDVLYATSEAGSQLRNKHKISIRIKDRREEHNCYIVVVEATDPAGKVDEATGAVSLIYPDKMVEWRNQQKVYIPHPKAGQHVEGLEYANAIKKAETQAKRRVALSICGLGIPDESEIEDMRQARVSAVETINNAVEDSADAKAAKLNQRLEVQDAEIEHLDSATQVAHSANANGNQGSTSPGEANRSAAFSSPAENESPLCQQGDAGSNTSVPDRKVQPELGQPPPAHTAPPQPAPSPQPSPAQGTAAVLSDDEVTKLEGILMALPAPLTPKIGVGYIRSQKWIPEGKGLQHIDRSKFNSILTKTPAFVRFVTNYAKTQNLV